jgi:peptide/nickel transport system permease protein
VGEADQKMLAEMRASFGYDKPLPVQYFLWLGATLTGDMGYSLRTGAPVFPTLMSAARNTIGIGIGAALLGFVLGVTSGLLAGYNHGTWIDKAVSSGAIAGVSMPHYWLAIILVIIFSVHLGWLPSMGSGSGEAFWSWAAWRHMVLPVVALAAIPGAIIARTARAAVMEILNMEFVEALRARGLSERRILWHVARNALPTVLAVMGLQFAHLLGGSILVETVFTWPGTGYLLNLAIFDRDMPVLQGTIMLLALFFVLTNLVVDILQAWADPRITRS